MAPVANLVAVGVVVVKHESLFLPEWQSYDIDHPTTWQWPLVETVSSCLSIRHRPYPCFPLMVKIHYLPVLFVWEPFERVIWSELTFCVFVWEYVFVCESMNQSSRSRGNVSCMRESSFTGSCCGLTFPKSPCRQEQHSTTQHSTTYRIVSYLVGM